MQSSVGHPSSIVERDSEHKSSERSFDNNQEAMSEPAAEEGEDSRPDYRSSLRAENLGQLERKTSTVSTCSHFAVMREKVSMPSDLKHVLSF